MTIRFDEALRNLLALLGNLQPRFRQETRCVLVRDLRSQMRLICEASHPPALSEGDTAAVAHALGSFRAAGDFVISLTASEGFNLLYEAPESVQIHPGLRFLDRVVSGREWLFPTAERPSKIKRFAFFGLKGGVGRSTALSMTAWNLAQLGLKVLVVDLDLESPGLGNMLLPVRGDLETENDSGLPGWPKYGMVDWFVEDGVEQADEQLLSEMVHPSPIQGLGRGEIHVVPAAGGLYKQDYISKLSRVYADLPAKDGTKVFGDRLLRALESLEGFVKPDVVLLDSRAGIHHISAAVLTRTGSTSYLFASDSRQTWAGYNSLFDHWSLKVETVRALRENIRLVSALTPSTAEKEEWRDSFGEHAFDTFVRLYDDEALAEGELEGADLFSFGVFEDGAPHRPVIVWDSPIYTNFDPLALNVQFNEQNATRVFTELFDRVELDYFLGDLDESI